MSNNDKIKVLVIEDLPETQEMVRSIFHQRCQNCDLTIAGTGVVALTTARLTKYDIIFTNIFLPDIDGITITKIIRRTEGFNQATPIIAFTALSGYKNQCLAVGMNDIIDKMSANLRLIIKQTVDKFRQVI